MDKHSSRTLAAAFVGLVAACGGAGDYGSGGGGFAPAPAPPAPGTPAVGRFIDSAVQGLSYTCGSSSGLTTAAGEFNYLVGQSCSFAVGGIVLGSTAGAQAVTPRELVANAIDETHPSVNNIARLLLSLDDDGDPGNGIVIADGVRTALAGATLNLRSVPATFATAAQALLDTVIPGRTLLGAALAEAHLKDSLLGLLEGHYDCQFFGSGYGTVTIDVSQGVIHGTGRDDETGAMFQVSGTLQSSGSASLGATGSTNSGATFTGTFSANGSGAGTWQDATGSGGWSCARG